MLILFMHNVLKLPTCKKNVHTWLQAV